MRKVTFLDQHVFDEFFSKDPINELILYTIDCKDCRSYWLVRTDKYSTQTELMRCIEGSILDKFFKIILFSNLIMY